MMSTTEPRMFTLPSTSHEYLMFSWWAANASGTSDTEMVGEVSGHRPVWGLRPGAQVVRAELTLSSSSTASSSSSKKKTEKKKWTIEAVAEVGAPGVVGLLDTPARLTLLKLSLPAALAWETFAREVEGAYTRNFALVDLPIYYTRKIYESVEWKLFGTVPKRSIDSVKLQGGVARELLDDARRFLSDEKEYARFGRPYKRVYCLHGPPGTGKSSLIMAIASELDKPLAIFNVDSLRDDTFIELLTTRPEGSILMFEDVDAMFRGEDDKGKGKGNKGGSNTSSRETASGEKGMTFSTLLNALDGALHPRGAMVFLTTNHLDRIDEALRRPGRIDRLVLVPSLSVEQAMEIWRGFYPPPAPALDRSIAARLVNALKMSPAALSQELFVRRDQPAATVAKALAALRRESNTAPAPA